MIERVSSPQFYVFSDNTLWVKESLQIDAISHLVDNNRAAASYIDMQLKSHYKQHIIADSSFNRWGPWMGDCPSSIVVAPDAGFASRLSPGDLFHTHWEVI